MMCLHYPTPRGAQWPVSDTETDKFINTETNGNLCWWLSLCCKNISTQFCTTHFYRPQTKLRKCNVFTSVCQEFCPREGWGVHPPWADPPRQTPPSDGHCSGRYASYWNAFLLSVSVVWTQTVLLIGRAKLLVLLMSMPGICSRETNSLVITKLDVFGTHQCTTFTLFY